MYVYLIIFFQIEKNNAGTLLNSVFFPTAFEEQEISVNGVAELTVGGSAVPPTRRLVKSKVAFGGAKRALQDGTKVESDFAANIAVTGPEAESAGYTFSQKIASAVTGVAVAAAMLL